MSTFSIKLLAVVLMVIDHVGFFLMPSATILRIIGRLSFPLFAFLIVNGYVYTSNFKKFFTRLFVFAVIIQLPVLWIDIPVNIFFTLSFGLLMIHIYEKEPLFLVKIFYMFGVLVITYILNPDYSLYGVLLIFCIHLFKGKWFSLALSFMILSLVFYGNNIQIYAVFSIPIMMLYNEKLGFKIKWLFYLFYPTHLVILNFISERMEL